jgi:hypothetical protein
VLSAFREFWHPILVFKQQDPSWMRSELHPLSLFLYQVTHPAITPRSGQRCVRAFVSRAAAPPGMSAASPSGAAQCAGRNPPPASSWPSTGRRQDTWRTKNAAPISRRRACPPALTPFRSATARRQSRGSQRREEGDDLAVEISGQETRVGDDLEVLIRALKLLHASAEAQTLLPRPGGVYGDDPLAAPIAYLEGRGRANP